MASSTLAARTATTLASSSWASSPRRVLKDRRSPRERGRMGTSVTPRRRRDGATSIAARSSAPDDDDAPPPPPSVASSPSRWTGPPVNRLDEQAARERVMRLATTTTQGAGALEAMQGFLSSTPGVTNDRLALFRYPSVKCPLDTVALNLIETRWVVAFDALANAPRRPGDPPFCFGITHPALTVRSIHRSPYDPVRVVNAVP